MRTCLVFLCLLAATFALSVKNKPHGKHHGLHKASHTAKEKDGIKVETNKALILPTLATFVASSPEPENEELSSVDNKDDEEVTEKREKSTAVLLSEEELVDLLKKEAEEEEEAEERELEEEEEEVEADKGNVESREGEETMVEEKIFDDISGTREEEEVKEESEGEAEEVMSHMEESVGKMADREEQVTLLEESEGSTESEILADLDYAADSSTIQSLQTDDTISISKTDVVDAKEKEATEKELTSIVDDYSQDVQNTEKKDSEEVSDQGKDKDSLVSSKETSARQKEPEANVDLQDQMSSEELDLTRLSGKEEEKNKDNSGSHTRGKKRKQKKNKRASQRDEAPLGLEESQHDSPESEDADNTVQKAKRRREGKWVKNKPHGKHHGLHKASHTAKEKDVIKEETNEALILPTLATFVANSPEPENEELSSVDNKNDEVVTKKREKSTPELLSEEELVDLLKKEAEEEEEVKEREMEEEEEEEEEVEADKGNVESREGQETMGEEKTSDGILETREEEESEGKAEEVEKMSHMEESDGKMADREEQMPLLVLQDQKSSEELDLTRLSGKEEEKNKNNSGSQTRGKTRKQRKNKRVMKHSLQSDEAPPGLEESQQDSPMSEDADNTVQKAKRRREGKWGPLVGMNPVQIRATADLYPSTRVSLGGRSHLSEDHADPCDDFRCKRGKTCKLDADNKPQCVCQEPSDCLSSMNEFDHVCGTDNNTYDTSCELFATKCKLEGTKKGHRLHLDYTGACKLIPPCLDTELIQFPLRMRDWLKNVLLQLYEHDSVSHGFLTSKQRFRVRKIFESVRRLHAGNHSVDLLAQDFEKNYNMYIYPVHWQFAQLDQHPSDRFLSHSELAPLRVPLVPMEHCTSTFFHECDADKDKQVSFKEWTSCFGIRNEDMDVSLLF